MSGSFVEYLNIIKPNDESIEIATRAFIAEYCNDILPDEMRDKILNETGERVLFDDILLKLENSPIDRRDACINFLLWAWENQNNQDKIKAAFEGSLSKLPAIEIGILAIVAMYGMYLAATGGKKEEIISLHKDKNGKYIKKKSIKYQDPVGPMSLITKLFSFFPRNNNKSSNDN